MERPRRRAAQDWYFFGYGHDYQKALGDYVRVAGRIPLPPRFAFGAWWSRYWAYSDQETRRDWCAASAKTIRRSTCSSSTWTGTSADEQLDGSWRERSVGPDPRLDRLHLEQAALPRSRRISREASRGRTEGHAQSASRFGHAAVGSRPIPRWRAPWASIRRRRNMCRSTSPIKNSRPTT